MPLELKNKTPVQSNQDAFDRAWDRLVTNYHLGQCADEHDKLRTCSYRKFENGQVTNACAIGWMLPDHLEWNKPITLPSFRTVPLVQAGITSVIAGDPVAAEWLSRAGGELLIHLQDAHDGMATMTLDAVKEDMRLIAHKWYLMAPE